eukprot:COSAG04_NODE_1105_length_8235_cov_48.668142_2_plen_120_part_00
MIVKLTTACGPYAPPLVPNRVHLFVRPAEKVPSRVRLHEVTVPRMRAVEQAHPGSADRARSVAVIHPICNTTRTSRQRTDPEPEQEPGAEPGAGAGCISFSVDPCRSLIDHSPRSKERV